MRKLLFALPIIALTIACSPAQQEENQKPLSWKELNTTVLNARIVQALREDHTWPYSPLELTTHLFGGDDSVRQVSLNIQNNSGESPNQSTVTYIRKGFLDDSVNGDWHEIELNIQSDHSWRVSSAKAAYQCSRGDNAGQYQAGLCP